MSFEPFLKKVQAAPFEPYPLLTNGHLQTLVCSMVSRKRRLLPQHSEHRWFQVEPGLSVLAQCHWRYDKATTPCLLLLHGLVGSAESPYMIGTAEEALKAGFNVVRLNMRNCGEVEPKPTFYHAGLTSDPRQVISELIEKDGLQCLFLVGFSLGGNIFLKYAGEEGAGISPALKGVMAVSPSVYLPDCIELLEKRSNLIYHEHFVRSLKQAVRDRARHNPGWLDLAPLKSIRTLRQFDDVYTGPYSGFRDATDYYNQSSSRQFIPQIKVPTMILHAKDDPFVPYAPLECAEVRANPNVHLLATDKGGHVAFLARHRENGSRYWAEHRIMDFVRSRLEAGNHG
ncbi:MAG: alpha/beta fold hydrolase [Blastocatellia bacterium]|nr:alpha/beta fold hydrolase [Blastocatellia bacterium]